MPFLIKIIIVIFGSEADPRRGRTLKASLRTLKRFNVKRKKKDNSMSVYLLHMFYRVLYTSYAGTESRLVIACHIIFTIFSSLPTVGVVSDERRFFHH